MSSRVPLAVASGMLAVGLVGWLGFRQQQVGAGDQATQRCEASMRTIVVAVELYRTNQHRPPEQLEKLVPRYLEKLPPCPVAKKDTYSPSYQVYGQKYTLFCRGHHHRREDHPAYSSVRGWDRR